MRECFAHGRSGKRICILKAKVIPIALLVVVCMAFLSMSWSIKNVESNMTIYGTSFVPVMHMQREDESVIPKDQSLEWYPEILPSEFDKNEIEQNRHAPSMSEEQLAYSNWVGQAREVTISAKKSEKKNATENKLSVSITHYCACSKCCGKPVGTKNGKEYWVCSDGTKVYNGMPDPYIIAANFGEKGDKVIIDGISYTIRDRFGGGDYHQSPKIDLFTPAGHAVAKQLGRRQNVTVKLIEK